MRIVGVERALGDGLGADGLGVDLDQDLGCVEDGFGVAEGHQGEVLHGPVVAQAGAGIDLPGGVDGGRQERIEVLDGDGAGEADQ